jgi:hypothetical protein
MSEVATIKMDTSGIKSAIERMIPQSKQELGDMLRNEVARPLLRKIISITPPANGSANGAAKKAGEKLIKSDISRIMRPATAAYLDIVRQIWGGDSHAQMFGHAGASPIGYVYERILVGFGQLYKWHEERRSKATGRVGFRGINKVANWKRLEKRGLLSTNRDRANRLTTGVRRSDLRNLDLALVLDTEYRSYVAAQQQKVGILAAGWNPAAEELGVSRPAWISRHGAGHGHCSIQFEGEKLSILISNDVRYANRVADLQARVQKALDWQARDMNRRVDDFAKKTVKL